MVKYPATCPTKLIYCSWVNPSCTSVKETPCEDNKKPSPLLSRFTSNIRKQALRDLKDWRVSIYNYLQAFIFFYCSEYSKAEKLYLRSIDIGLKLFGPGYSGLEYDYRGLIRVYQETQDWTSFFSYQYKLRDWKTLRDQREGEHGSEPIFLLAQGTSQSISSIVLEVTKCLGSDLDDEKDIGSNRTVPALS